MRILPQKYRDIYEEFYINYSQANTFFRKLSLLVERWYHLKAYNAKTKAHAILELGSGNLNHVKFEKNFKQYDVIEPKEFLIKASNPLDLEKINNIYKSIDDLPKEKLYDKIISIAVLEHVENLDSVLEKLSQKLSKKGKFIVEIPAEGELLWWLGWRLTTGIGFWFKYKLDYGVIMRYEHVNNAEEILYYLRKYFKIKLINSFPFNIKNFRLYIHLEMVKKPYFEDL